MSVLHVCGIHKEPNTKRPTRSIIIHVILAIATSTVVG